ncbi:MAG TPA: zinc-dependent metalloprotease [Cellulomonas sp.]
MSADVPFDPASAGWEQLLRSMLGSAADDVIAELRAGGFDPASLPTIPGMPTDPESLRRMAGQMQQMMAAGGEGGVNWEMAHELARQQASTGGDPSVGAGERRAVTDAFSVAELWLDDVTDLPASGASGRAWSRAEWVEATLPTWRTLTEPIATSLATALSGALGATVGDELGPESTGLDVTDMVHRLGQTVFGLQVGQAVGTLAREVFGATDIGLPLLASPVPVLVPGNVSDFGEGLGVPADELRLFLALREAAATRLVTHVPWLRSHLLGAVEAYARGITIDTDQLEEAVRSVDATDPEALQAALSGGVFGPQTTPEQQAALDRLETSLALVEGWVDEVSAAAALAHLPHAVALREMMRRRRAAGGPAEQMLATLVGLQLRPRRLRDAATLWAAIAAERGQSGRDAVWTHPDLMPSAADLDDPSGYAARQRDADAESAALDAAIAEILDDTGSGGDGEPGGDDTPQGR